MKYILLICFFVIASCKHKIADSKSISTTSNGGWLVVKPNNVVIVGNNKNALCVCERLFNNSIIDTLIIAKSWLIKQIGMDVFLTGWMNTRCTYLYISPLDSILIQLCERDKFYTSLKPVSEVYKDILTANRTYWNNGSIGGMTGKHKITIVDSKLPNYYSDSDSIPFGVIFGNSTIGTPRHDRFVVAEKYIIANYRWYGDIAIMQTAKQIFRRLYEDDLMPYNQTETIHNYDIKNLDSAYLKYYKPIGVENF